MRRPSGPQECGFAHATRRSKNEKLSRVTVYIIIQFIEVTGALHESFYTISNELLLLIELPLQIGGFLDLFAIGISRQDRLLEIPFDEVREFGLFV